MIVKILLSLYISSILFFHYGNLTLQIKARRLLKQNGYIKSDDYEIDIFSLMVSLVLIIFFSILPIYNIILGYHLMHNKQIFSETMELAIFYGKYEKSVDK